MSCTPSSSHTGSQPTSRLLFPVLLAAAQYLGCFYNTGYRALPTMLNPADVTSVTIEECQGLAAAATPVQPLYGVSDGECYGGADFQLATSVGKARESKCTDGSSFEVRRGAIHALQENSFSKPANTAYCLPIPSQLHRVDSAPLMVLDCRALPPCLNP